MQYFLMIWFNRTLTILILYLLCTCIHFLSIYQHERSITTFNKISSPYSHDIDVHLPILRKTLSSSLQRNKCLLIQNIFSTFQQITSIFKLLYWNLNPHCMILSSLLDFIHTEISYPCPSILYPYHFARTWIIIKWC